MSESPVKHYIFTVRGDSRPGMTAFDLLQSRTESGMWPLNRLTPHQRDLKKGDRILIYVAGGSDPNRHHVIAEGELCGGRVPSARTEGNLPPWLNTRPVLWDVPMRILRIFDRPVAIRHHLDKLSFVKNKERWGTYLQGGVRYIEESDYRQLVSVE